MCFCQAGFVQPTLDSSAQQQAEHGQEKYGHYKLVSGRVALEASGFNVALFARCSVGVGVAEGCPMTYAEVLVQTPLFGT